MIATIEPSKDGFRVHLLEGDRVVGVLTAPRIVRYDGRLFIYGCGEGMTLFPDFIRTERVGWERSSDWSLEEAVPLDDAPMPIVGITADEYLALCEEDPDRADMMERGESDE